MVANGVLKEWLNRQFFYLQNSMMENMEVVQILTLTESKYQQDSCTACR